METTKYLTSNIETLKFLRLWPPIKKLPDFIKFEIHMGVAVGSLIIFETMYAFLEDIKYYELLKSISAIGFHVYAILSATQFLLNGSNRNRKVFSTI